jgi:hypothetical protein
MRLGRPSWGIGAFRSASSQAWIETSVDYRRDQFRLAYAPCSLPDAVTKALGAFLDRLGLSYGAFDLIARPDGALVFLELNPVGQWLWIEQRANIDISGAIDDLLIGR